MRSIEKIPAVFIHTGFPDYLKKTIACAREHHNYVIILGNQENAGIQADEWYPMTDFGSTYFDTFQSVYIHRSANPVWFEMICFERYFVLLEFMKQNNLKECFMIDSDTLLFGDVQDLDCRSYDGGGGTEKIFVNPCILYWKISALEDFVLFCLTQYQNPKQWLLLEERYLNLKKEAPYAEINLCDMLLLNLWTNTTPYEWKDFFAENNNYLIDGNINHPQCADTHKNTYKMIKELSIKKYTFKDGIPCLSDSADEITPVFAIHCQGSAKQYIDSLFRQNSCL